MWTVEIWCRETVLELNFVTHAAFPFRRRSPSGVRLFSRCKFISWEETARRRWGGGEEKFGKPKGTMHFVEVLAALRV